MRGVVLSDMRGAVRYEGVVLSDMRGVVLSDMRGVVLSDMRGWYCPRGSLATVTPTSFVKRST